MSKGFYLVINNLVVQLFVVRSTCRDVGRFYYLLKVEMFKRRKQTSKFKSTVYCLFSSIFQVVFHHRPLFFHFNDVFLSFSLTCINFPAFFYLQLFILSRNKFVILHADAVLNCMSHYTMMNLIIDSVKIKFIFNCNFICRILALIENAV
jgi:hypothetical protein